jgi:hypothetical protein
MGTANLGAAQLRDAPRSTGPGAPTTETTPDSR